MIYRKVYKKYTLPLSIFVVFENVNPVIWTSESFYPNSYIAYVHKSWFYSLNIFFRGEVFLSNSTLIENSAIDNKKNFDFLNKSQPFLKNTALLFYVYYFFGRQTSQDSDITAVELYDKGMLRKEPLLKDTFYITVFNTKGNSNGENSTFVFKIHENSWVKGIPEYYKLYKHFCNVRYFNINPVPVSGKETVFVRSGYLSQFYPHSILNNTLLISEGVFVVFGVQNFDSSKGDLIQQQHAENLSYNDENPVFVFVSEMESVLSITQSGWLSYGVCDRCWHRMVLTRSEDGFTGLVQFLLNLELNPGCESISSKLYFNLVDIHSMQNGSKLNLSLDYLNTNSDLNYLPFSVDIFVRVEENLIYIDARVEIPLSEHFT